MIEYVELADAQAATGIRIVVAGLVPSPWSEATKGLFKVAGIPVKCVRTQRNHADIVAWTGIDNVPIVLNGDEPPRTSWAAITGFVARLAPGVLLPDDPRQRAQHMGLIEMIAGEDGLGWSARAAMISANGFPAPVNARLATRYVGGSDRVARQLAILGERLAEQQELGHAFLAGPTIGALDVYAATFLSPLTDLDETACPRLLPPLRAAFGMAAKAFAHHVPDALWAHRTRIMNDYLGWPIEI